MLDTGMGERGREVGLAVEVPDAFRSAFETAQTYVARYFADRVEDPVRGVVELSGERYVLIRAAAMSTEFVDMVMGLYRDRGEQEAWEVATAFQYDIAHAIGAADARLFHAKMGVTDPIERLSAGPIHFAFAGWAKVQILPESRPSPDDDYFLVYNHPYSFEADSWLRRGRRSAHPVCMMNAGYSSGWCEESFGVALVAAEVACRAAGDSDCRFVMAPPSRIHEYLASHAHGAATPAAQPRGPIEVPEFFKRKRLEEDLRQSKEVLEELVSQRTRALTETNEQLLREAKHRRSAESQLVQAQKMEALGNLAGGIAHDFNNLLTAILSSVQLAMRHTDEPEVEGWLRHAREATERAADLTTRMLSIGREKQPEMAPTDLAEVVTNTARFLSRTLPENVSIEVEMEQRAALVIRAHTAQLEQTLINLAINARDAMPDGGTMTFSVDHVELEAGAVVNPEARPGRFVRITVADTGAGIPPELRDRIFEPFFTTKASGGTGLGLAMVFQCGRAHAGWVAVDSTVGRGSSFHVYLPWVPAQVQASDLDTEPEETATEVILLVDDNEAILVSGQSMLEALGYRVLIARDGDDALRQIRELGDQISVVVSDLVMRNMGGRDLLTAVRSRGIDTPVILISGHALDRSAEELLAEGFAAFVTKPFDGASLNRALRRVLDS